MAWLTFPLVANAKSYDIYAHDFFDPLFWGREIRTTVFPNQTHKACSDTGYSGGKNGSEYWFLLSGGAGPGPAGPSVAALTSRFSGMVVEVTVHY